ncbi:MAG: hypothetical protein R3C14_23185 [Caldilineaceae bacterium]
MYRNRFNISAQTLAVSVVATTLLYLLFSVVQPIGSALGAALLQSVTGANTTPPYLNYQGMLRDAEGKPISGVHKLTFRIYKDVTDPLPAALWMEEHNEVTVRDGQFSVLLGNNKPVPPELFTGPDLFIGVTVAPLDEMVPRQRFASAPYAMYADHAAALTAPNGSSTHAVHVDNTGWVGIGTTNPQAQLQISTTTGSALQVDAGAQHLTVNNNGIYVQGDTDNPDMMLDLKGGGAAQKGEYLFGVDGQRRASIYYDKSTNKAGMVNGNTQLNLYDNGWVETFSNLGVNGEIHSTSNIWLQGNLTMGLKPGRKPVKIVRITHLPENGGRAFPEVPAADYECTVGSWSTGLYDINENGNGTNKVWAYVEDGWWWVGVNFSSHNKNDTPSIDVVCFLKGIVEYDTTYGIREDQGN